jgi:hypothetical protein
MKLIYKAKGQIQEKEEFSGHIHLDGKLIEKEDWEKVFGEGIDLSRVPVIALPGKGDREETIEKFKKENPGFRGAFFLTPYSKSYGWYDGGYWITSEHLSGKRISGGKPEERWLTREWKGNQVVADRGVFLNGRQIKIIQEKASVPYSIGDIINTLIQAGERPYGHFEWSLSDRISKTEREWESLDRKVRSPYKTKSDSERNEILRKVITEDFQKQGITQVEQIPTDYPSSSLTIERLDPDLWARREERFIEVPGLGRREVTSTIWDSYLRAVELTHEEVSQITSWPFSTIAFKTPGLEESNWKTQSPYTTLLQGKQEDLKEIKEQLDRANIYHARPKENLYPDSEEKPNIPLPSPIEYFSVVEGKKKQLLPRLWRRGNRRGYGGWVLEFNTEEEYERLS